MPKRGSAHPLSQRYEADVNPSLHSMAAANHDRVIEQRMQRARELGLIPCAGSDDGE